MWRHSIFSLYFSIPYVSLDSFLYTSVVFSACSLSSIDPSSTLQSDQFMEKMNLNIFFRRMDLLKSLSLEVHCFLISFIIQVSNQAVFSPFLSYQSSTWSWLMLFSTLKCHMPFPFIFSLHCVCSSTPFMNHSFTHWIKRLRKMSMLWWVKLYKARIHLKVCSMRGPGTHHSSKPLGMSCENDTSITKKLTSGSFLLTRNDSMRCNPRTSSQIWMYMMRP